MLYLTLVFNTCIYRFYILHLCTLVQHWYKCYLYLCVVFENGALKINTCACVVLVLCGAKFDSGDQVFPKFQPEKSDLARLKLNLL